MIVALTFFSVSWLRLYCFVMLCRLTLPKDCKFPCGLMRLLDSETPFLWLRIFLFSYFRTAFACFQDSSAYLVRLDGCVRPGSIFSRRPSSCRGC